MQEETTIVGAYVGDFSRYVGGVQAEKKYKKEGIFKQ